MWPSPNHIAHILSLMNWLIGKQSGKTIKQEPANPSSAAAQSTIIAARCFYNRLCGTGPQIERHPSRIVAEQLLELHNINSSAPPSREFTLYFKPTPAHTHTANPPVTCSSVSARCSPLFRGEGIGMLLPCSRCLPTRFASTNCICH